MKKNSDHSISNTHYTGNTESEVARDSAIGSSDFPPRDHNEISTRVGYLPSLTPPPIQKRKDKVPEKKYSFEIPPEPLPASDIKEEIVAEVVVVGAGIAGLSASISAAEAGAKTILIEKMATVQARGHDNAFLNSRLQKKLGIEINKEEVILNLMKYGNFSRGPKYSDSCYKLGVNASNSVSMGGILLCNRSNCTTIELITDWS